MKSLTGTLLLSLALLACLSLAGCPNHPESPTSLSATGNAVARAQVRGESAISELSMIKVGGDGKVHLDVAGKNLLDQKKDLTEAQAQLTQASKDSAVKDGQIAQLTSDVRAATQKGQADVANVKASPEYKVGHFFMSALRIALVLLFVAVVLRVIGLMVKGPVGAIAAFASTGIIGVLTCGISLIQTGFDNLHFRTTWTPPAPAA